MKTTQKTPRSESPQRRDKRRSAPPSGAPASPDDGPHDPAGAEHILPSSDSLRLDHARELRSLLERFAAEYDLEEHLSRSGRPKAWSEGATAACAICADPGPVISAFLSTLDTAIEGAGEAEVGSHE
jgi:hypothetical protein